MSANFKIDLIQSSGHIVDALAAEERHVFGLKQAPLWRAVLVTESNNDNAEASEAGCSLVLNFHHILVDGSSIAILWRDLLILYEAAGTGTEKTGRENLLPPLVVQYADFALWEQQTFTNSAAAELELAYWRQALAGCPDPEATSQSGLLLGFKASSQRLSLSPAVVQRLRAVSLVTPLAYLENFPR